MAPACVLQSIKSTLPGKLISSSDRKHEETSSNRNQPLSNNTNNNNSSNSNNNKNDNNKRNESNNNDHNPLSSLNPVLNRQLYKRDSDMDDMSSSHSSLNDSQSSDDFESRLSRFWYCPSTSSSTPRRFPDDSSTQKLRNMDFKSFKVMTFNTLAQSLVDYKYLENDQSTMSWSKRRHEIYKVVKESDSDIVCLQEIDELDYINFFKEKVEKLGYECVYKRKLQNRLDGILTMFKKDRFKLVMKNELNFSCDYEEYDKPQVALIVALRDMYTTQTSDKGGDSNSSSTGVASTTTQNTEEDTTQHDGHTSMEDLLLVANTHLIFNKSRGDVKLYQLLNLLSGVKETYESSLSYLKGQKSNPNTNTNNDTNSNSSSTGVASTTTQNTEEKDYLEPNVLICGDFNITPQSLMYNLLFKGFAPLKNTNPRCLSGQYLMFDQTYLTSSSGHNESGETLGNIKHYMGDVYSDYVHYSKDYSTDNTAVSSVKSYTPSLELGPNQSGVNTGTSGTSVNSNSGVGNSSTTGNASTTTQSTNTGASDLGMIITNVTNTASSNTKQSDAEAKENLIVSRIKALDMTLDSYTSNQFTSYWYKEVLDQVKKQDFTVKPKFLDQKDVDEFLNLLREHSEKNAVGKESDELVEHFRSKLNLGLNAGFDNSSSTGNASTTTLGNEQELKEEDNLSSYDIIYCPFKLKSAYSADDGFNCEPAFTAFHGWQKGCVDYISYNPDNTLLEGIYEMPLYTQVKENGDLPHKKWPASDHFSLVSQFRRFK